MLECNTELANIVCTVSKIGTTREKINQHCQNFKKFTLIFLYFADRASQYVYLNINQLDALNFIVSLFHASTCFEHTCSSSGDRNCIIQYNYDTRGCIVQFWPPNDEHVCSKHVEA